MNTDTTQRTEHTTSRRIRERAAPEKRLIGRFSWGMEQLPDSPEKRMVGRFSWGMEQLPDTA